ncbi:MAG: hypothetical protein ACJ8BW_06285, partial [Ktedonobacteraceae bacterium]
HAGHDVTLPYQEQVHQYQISDGQTRTWFLLVNTMLAPNFERKNQMVIVIFISYHIHVTVSIPTRS